MFRRGKRPLWRTCWTRYLLRYELCLVAVLFILPVLFAPLVLKSNNSDNQAYEDSHPEDSQNARENILIWVVVGLGRFIHRYRDDINALSTLGVFIFTAGIAGVSYWQGRLILRAERDTRRGLTIAKRQAEAAEKSAVETRRVGEAQVRAYVAIPEASIEFLGQFQPGELHPIITIRAKNSGQSPAQEFVWRATVQYIASNQFRERGINNWVGEPGFAISANDGATDRLMLPDMALLQFIRSGTPPNPNVLIRIQIVFRYRDVFGTQTVEEVFFAGIADQVLGDTPRWTVNLGPMVRPRDWSDSTAFNRQ